MPFRAFRRSLHRPPALSYIVPTDVHNMHSSATSVGDEWLQRWIPRVMHSRGFRHHGAIFITWDEADKTDRTGCCVDRDPRRPPAASSRSSTTARATSA